MTYEKIVWAGWFALDVPETWRIDEEEPEIVIHGGSEGVGAVTISIYSAHPGITPNTTAVELAQQFASQKGWDQSGTTFQPGYADQSCEFEYIHKGDESESWYWQVKVEKSVKGFVLLTYNCAVNDQAAERKVRRHIFESFAWVD